ncbi:hypothetical protein [Paenibacillus hamazuiensis]|uniref:hypothetical protein n=1 Tax=Paenibacillus hamazuiensis TaxID=2936508 RepID=UPI00200E8F21|nr:hypothetical protein [Paenibacillus hamazuiensis]
MENKMEERMKYPSDVMKAVRKRLGTSPDSADSDSQIEHMLKTEIMDIYLESKEIRADGRTIREVVNDVFGISLDTISASGEGSLVASYPADIMEGVRMTLNIDPASAELDTRIMSMSKTEVMDRFLDAYGKPIAGSEVRRVINEIFGLNLNGLAALEKAKLSIFSKGQWMTRNSGDMIEVITGKGDVDVSVGVTDHYEEIVGTDQLPEEIQRFMSDLGFAYIPDKKTYYYSNPAGESVPDSFKGQLIGKLTAYIRDHFTD